MHDIIEHNGKVVIALAGVLAVSDISYKEHIYDAIDASRPGDGE